MMSIVIKWMKTYIPHTVIEVETFNEADEKVVLAMVLNGQPYSINVFENHITTVHDEIKYNYKLVANLRTMR